MSVHSKSRGCLSEMKEVFDPIIDFRKDNK